MVQPVGKSKLYEKINAKTIPTKPKITANKNGLIFCCVIYLFAVHI